MKQTHKFRELNDVAEVVAKASSLTAAARALGVDRSTLHRWIEAGKIPRPGSKPRALLAEAPTAEAKPPAEAAAVDDSPAAWGAGVRERYALSETDLEVLRLAVDALTMARNREARDLDRLSAMGRFQQLVRQLNLDMAGERLPAGQPVAMRPRAPARASSDPRAILMAVK